MDCDNYTRTFVCCHCQKQFTGRRRKFCSRGCMIASNNERKRNPSTEKACAWCSAAFVTSGKSSYCGDNCRDEAKRHRDRNRNKKPPADCGQCGIPCLGRRRKYCSDKCSREAWASGRDYLMERIRSDTRKGRCGPPTYESWLEMTSKPDGGKRMDSLPHYPDSLITRNARDAWRYWIKQKAPDEWVERYFAAMGKPWLNRRLTDAERYRLKYQHCRRFALQERMRRQVTKARKRDGVAELIRGAVNRGGASRKVEALLGYTIEDLQRHIERQFTKGMSWERFRDGSIHIDHIVPQAAFDLTSDEQWRTCWCLSNLRPCWAKENLRKRSKALFLI